jgi:hypothetical protein
MSGADIQQGDVWLRVCLDDAETKYSWCFVIELYQHEG